MQFPSEKTEERTHESKFAHCHCGCRLNSVLYGVDWDGMRFRCNDCGSFYEGDDSSIQWFKMTVTTVTITKIEACTT